MSGWLAGNEHTVVVQPDERRVIKLTHPDRYHILHVFQHGAMLGQERGSITCQGKEDARPRTMPLEDLRAVVVAHSCIGG